MASGEVSRSACAVHTTMTDRRPQHDDIWLTLQHSCKFKEYNSILERWESRHLPGSEDTNDCVNKVMLHIWQECTVFVMTPAMFRTIPASGVLRRDYPSSVICDIGQTFRRRMFTRRSSCGDAGATGLLLLDVQHSPPPLADQAGAGTSLCELVGKVFQWDGTQADCFGPSGSDLV